jgi:hypothetical protein
MNSGLIRKAKFDSGFVQIPNALAQNPNLSAKEKGIMLFLLSLPDDWIVYKTQIQKYFTDGRDGIIAGFDKLIEKGYIKTERVNDPSTGHIGFNYIVSPFPEFPEAVNPKPANPETEMPKPVNPELQKKDSTKKNVTKKNTRELSDDISSVPLPFADPMFVTAWNAWVECRASARKKLTVIAATAQLKLLGKYDLYTAVEMIEQSIRNQWQGIFELKSNGNGRKNNNVVGGGTQAQFGARYEKYKQLDQNP